MVFFWMKNVKILWLVLLYHKSKNKSIFFLVSKILFTK